ncbi:MAG: hypothetical protein KGS72_07285 [Cyanobacteria bacterium REEB67]|nr:hypothetical protein [Cyanobacteria bacterium REEB67]
MLKKFVFSTLLLGLGLWTSVLSALAAPPVRIAVVCGGGSGIEQEIVDRISNNLSSVSDIVLSTVNPDWYIVCNITENIDQASGAVRYNGSVIVKTSTGQVINTVAVQKYNQDFSLSAGAPLNKKLVDNAARDVISSAAERVLPPVQQAVMVEMETRDRIIKASTLAEGDHYAEAINLLTPITPDTPHFKDVRDLIDEFAMEQDALERLKSGKAKANKGHYREAIATLKDVNKKSKRYKAAQSEISFCRQHMSRS